MRSFFGFINIASFDVKQKKSIGLLFIATEKCF